MMYTSQFRKIDPYDWFCGPGSHLAYEFRQTSEPAKQSNDLQQNWPILKVEKVGEKHTFIHKLTTNHNFESPFYFLDQLQVSGISYLQKSVSRQDVTWSLYSDVFCCLPTSVSCRGSIFQLSDTAKMTTTQWCYVCTHGLRHTLPASFYKLWDHLDLCVWEM